MKKIITLVLLFFSTIVQAQTRIDFIQFIGATADSLVFIVHSSIDSEIVEYNVEYKEEFDNIKVNVLYSAGLDIDCYCPVQTTIKIKKDIYQKAIVSLMIRYPVGVAYSDYFLRDSKEIDLSNIASIDNLSILSKIAIFPNPVQNMFHINLEESKVLNLEIYDIQGNLLLNNKVTSEMGIDVSFLSSGLYFVVINKEHTYKIIKE